MRERLQEFSLSLHPEKTRLIEFGRFAAANRRRRGLGKPDLYEEAAVKGILRWCLAISGCGFRRTSSPADPQSGASNSDSR